MEQNRPLALNFEMDAFRTEHVKYHNSAAAGVATLGISAARCQCEGLALHLQEAETSSGQH